MFYAFSFLMGIAVGSFMGVLLSRVVPDAEDHVSFSRAMHGRSMCLACRRTLRWYELVPLVSFLVQGRKCRSCGARIPLQDFLIELVTGAAFVAIAWRFIQLLPFHSMAVPFLPVWWVLVLIALWWVVASLCVLIAFYDARYFLIPNVLLYLLVASAIAVNLTYAWFIHVIPWFPQTGMAFSGTLAYLFGASAFSWLRVGAGIAWATGLIGGAYLISRGKGMGFGDVLIALAFGILFGWPDVVMVLFAAFVLGTFASVALLALRMKTMKSLVPFGPFLMLGALTTVLFGVTLTTVYLRIFPGLLM